MADMDKLIDEHFVFRKLLSFFASDASIQSVVISDLAEERLYDLSDGHLVTKYPLQMLTTQFRAYTSRFWLEAGSPGFEYIDRNLCDEIRELADGILCVYENDPSMSQTEYWTVSTLHTRRIWNAMRRSCGAFLAQFPEEDVLDLGEKDFFEGFTV